MHGSGGTGPSPQGQRARVMRGDVAGQRARNAEAPRVPNLLPRIAALFAPHKLALSVTVVLVLIAAALSVIPPLLTQRAFDEGLFPPGGTPNLPLLATLVGIMMAKREHPRGFRVGSGA